MITRFVSALVRAIFVVLLIATPWLLMPGPNDSAPIVLLVAIFVGWLVFSEYMTEYPSLIEFRDAPPYNRLRFGALFATVLVLTLIQRGVQYPTPISQIFTSISHVVGTAMDFPFSPVRLMMLTLPEGTHSADYDLLRRTAGIAYLMSLISLVFFIFIMWLNGWPRQNGSFNVWTNLPTFDPTGGGDVVGRLNRDANLYVALGFLLPFLIPAMLKMASGVIDPIAVDQPKSLIWTISLWAFIPSSLLMRGIATARVASMIADKRRRSMDRDAEDLHVFG
ncbi:hypothetical protein HJ526_14715 [Donghicola sp. C2-DW-16]|uniref:Uncharacterized protein n=1 Tax=Donghicola mangrovi TaxID=2729614 RepID=A0ABX2PGQ9_9RHOB|nr:hypothetical protein [Donghicola mangrovi]